MKRRGNEEKCSGKNMFSAACGLARTSCGLRRLPATVIAILLCVGCSTTGRFLRGRQAVVDTVSGEVIVCRNGQAPATIVTAAEAPATVELAVLELQHHFRLMTGKQLGRVTDADDVAGPVILVGESARTRELGLHNTDFQRQEYLIQTRPDTLILMGRDRQVFGDVRYDDPLTSEEYISGIETGFPLYPGWTRWDAIGSCYAVYGFLERFCGVRWYLPGNEGMHVPRKQELVFSGLNLRRKPWMVYRQGLTYTALTPRKLYVGSRDRENMKVIPNNNAFRRMSSAGVLPTRATQLWFLRNKGWGDPFRANHSYNGWFNRFHEDHPDWFAQGRKPRRSILELCLTNPEVKRQMIQDARDYFDGKNPPVVAEGDYFAIVPTDIKQWCLCDRCQAKMDPPFDLDARKMGGKARIAASASRYVWDFIGEVADAIAESHPGKYISALAYTDYLVVPEGMKKRDNLAVMFCIQPTQTAFNPPFTAFNKKYLSRWAAVAGGGVYVWLYTCYPQYQFAGRFPDLSYHKYADWMRLFHKLGIKGFFDNQDWGVLVSGEETWNIVWPNPMEDLFRTYVMQKMADDISIDEQELYDEFYRLWYGGAAAAIKRFVLRSQELYNDPDYTVDGVVQPQGYHPERDVTPFAEWGDRVWGSVCTAENLEELGTYISQAHELADTPATKAHVKLFDEAVYREIVTGRSKWIPRKPEHAEAFSGKPSPWRLRRASCPRVTVDVPGSSRVIDWSAAGHLSEFILHGGESFGPYENASPSVSTDVKVMHDESYLYVRVACQDPETDKIVSDHAQLYRGDAVEIFFDPGSTGKFQQLLVNAKGDTHLEGQWDQDSWSKGASIHTEVLISETGIHDGAWIARIAIPFAALSVGAPSPGDTWRFNVCRDFRGMHELSAWSPSFGGWRQPQYFGELMFSDAP